MSAEAPRYAPYWCEENVWHLCVDDRVGTAEADVAIVTNADGRVALFHQRASTQRDGLVVWDYHVLLFARTNGWQAWDLDTTLGCPVSAVEYIQRTFPPRVHPGLAPRFRVMAAADYRVGFGSDRRHMRAHDGSWLQPPPSWPAIGHAHELPKLLDTADCTFAPWIDRDDLVRRYRVP